MFVWGFVLQCIAKTEGGKRVVAGVHWDYDCYGALLGPEATYTTAC
jgi:hypothetical protein